MAYTINVNVKADSSTIWSIGAPVMLTAGDTPTITVTYMGAASVSSPVGKVYQGSKDVTSTVMPSGSESASGNVVTLKPLTGLTGNRRYVVTVSVAEYPIKKILLRVQKASAKQ